MLASSVQVAGGILDITCMDPHMKAKVTTSPECSCTIWTFLQIFILLNELLIKRCEGSVVAKFYHLFHGQRCSPDQ
jgi:hypothetical protein